MGYVSCMHVMCLSGLLQGYIPLQLDIVIGSVAIGVLQGYNPSVCSWIL